MGGSIYLGDRTIDGIAVTVDGEALDPRFDIMTFSELGFEWTYEGAEPQQLALALLAHHLADDARALRLSESFMRNIVANFDNTWELSGPDIDAALAALDT
ncbi:MAG: hypothetical protein K0U93_27450 [Gammaproteobacteria bacterium]|nr:hypothetical protein [Gammaproteobacteria bacterium]